MFSPNSFFLSVIAKKKLCKKNDNLMSRTLQVHSSEEAIHDVNTPLSRPVFSFAAINLFFPLKPQLFLWKDPFLAFSFCPSDHFKYYPPS